MTGRRECYEWMLDKGNLKVLGITGVIGESIEDRSPVAIEDLRQQF